MEQTRGFRVAMLMGPVVAIAVAGLVVPARNWLGAANVALLLVVVVVGAAALSDRRAAAATAVSAALAFNFFHTKPYYTLRVSDRVDLTTIVLVLVVGLVAGELAVLRRRQATKAAARRSDLEIWCALVDRAARGDDAGLVDAALDTLRRELNLAACRFEAAGDEHGSYVLLSHGGRAETNTLRWTPDGFELPAEGVEVPVVRAGVRLGRLVLVPLPGTAVPGERRQLAVAVADLLATAHVTTSDRGLR